MPDDMIEEAFMEQFCQSNDRFVKRSNIAQFCQENDFPESKAYRFLEQYKVARGKWDLSLYSSEYTCDEAQDAEQVTSSETSNSNSVYPPKIMSKQAETTVAIEDGERCLIPQRDKNFVSFGNFSDVKKIISSRCFYPVFITGLSGNGKTFSIEQACAVLKREIVRVNITIETDEDDLIGGFRLKNGDTVWHDGPVVEAMKRGAILLLDEIDLASNKIMCLQSILEGKGVFLKKINQMVTPAPGFNIIATANTKGKGSDDGKFIGTNILNEAFLERFGLTFEQDYPSQAIEQSILLKLAKDLGILEEGWSRKYTPTNVESFLKTLTVWATQIRNTYREGGIDDVVSTRRLVHIVRAFAIFANKSKAMSVCLNRFDQETNEAFMKLYKSCAPESDDDTSDDTSGKASPTNSKDAAIQDAISRLMAHNASAMNKTTP